MLAALARLISLAPVLALLLALGGGSLVSAGVVWKAKDWWFDTVAEPQIRADQKRIDVAEFERLAAEAKRKREEALFRAVDRWSTQIYLEQVENEAWWQAHLSLLQDDIRKYEEGLGNEGTCGGLTDLDLQFLERMLPQFAPGGGSRGAWAGAGPVRTPPSPQSVR